MKIANTKDSLKMKIEKFPYKGKDYEVKNVWIQWLTQAGPEDQPEYGLRLFTVGPKGEIPIHQHFYYQTMYLLTGSLVATAYDPETNQPTMEQTAGTGELIFIPTTEPHGFVNPSDSQECTFLCCIANVYEDED